MNNSSTAIEVYKNECLLCNKHFFEGDIELENCPHCGIELEFENVKHISTENVDVGICAKTGVIITK